MLKVESQSITAKFIDPSEPMVEKPIEIRTRPIIGRTSHIAYRHINRFIFAPLLDMYFQIVKAL